MDRKRIIYLAAAAIIIFLVINPIGGRRRNEVKDRIPMGSIEQETIGSLTDYLKSHHQNPDDYVVGAFASRDIVFVSGTVDSGIIKEHVTFMGSLIPRLHAGGITHLGVFFALFEDQETIDRVVTDTDFDEEKVRQILFNRQVMWGYQEYVDIFRAAWELNRSLSPGAKPFRIVGLNVPYEWQHMVKEADQKDPAIQKLVLSKGLPSRYMADVILREIVDKGEKALIMIDPPHSFTRFRHIAYGENARSSGFSEVRTAGNIVYDRIGERAATVLLHYIWPFEAEVETGCSLALSNPYNLERPVEGYFDAVMYYVDEEFRHAGFSTQGTPFGDLPVDSGVYAEGYDSLTLKEICNGYILFGPLWEYTPVTPIPDFINSGNLDEAIFNFPSPKESLQLSEEREQNVGMMNSMIQGFLQNLDKMLTLFKLE